MAVNTLSLGILNCLCNGSINIGLWQRMLERNWISKEQSSSQLQQFLCIFSCQRLIRIKMISRRIIQMIAAASFSSWTTEGLLTPLSLAQNAGRSMSPVRPSANVETLTPWVSRYSRVRGISKKLLQPLLMTATGVLPSSVRSAETSIVCSPPR